MDERRSSTGRLKRQVKSLTDDSWDCSVCTYRNTAEAYKCEMCDVRKGTSTRKPRPNPQLVAAQAAQQFSILPHTKRDEQCSSRPLPSNKSKTFNKRRPRLKNIDRSSAKQMEVTVGSVTVVITDYEPKKGTSRQTSSETVSTVNTDSSDNNSSLLANDTTQDMATDNEERS